MGRIWWKKNCAKYPTIPEEGRKLSGGFLQFSQWFTSLSSHISRHVTWREYGKCTWRLSDAHSRKFISSLHEYIIQDVLTHSFHPNKWYINFICGNGGAGWISLPLPDRTRTWGTPKERLQKENCVYSAQNVLSSWANISEFGVLASGRYCLQPSLHAT